MLRPFPSLLTLLRPAGLSHIHHGAPSLLLRSSFTTTTSASLKQLPPRPKHPAESEIEESFLKGSGPGGQKINKTNSAVQLKHIPTGIVVKSQATRSRTQNRKIARDLLAAKLDELTNGPQSRTAIVSDVKKKRADSRAKKARRKYRKLAEEKKAGEEEEEVEEGEAEAGEGDEGVKELETDKRAEAAGNQGTRRSTSDVKRET